MTIFLLEKAHLWVILLKQGKEALRDNIEKKKYLGSKNKLHFGFNVIIFFLF